ncbi:NADH dehydrogenase (quinone), G subunit [Mycobacterium intracellulare 1956]|uniref:NADH-quinone oxidoreductase n=1 Tax=Mycobacterium intracellulare 1956 TaxID=1299331 RepID=X8CKV6_MYCIT|nr:NADH dehydrogenase (quinone), G subunit [Mycobacterium intracellulare 1956]
MTSLAKTETGDEVRPPEMVTLTIDGIEISVPKGTLVIRAAELMGIQIPRFCDHPLLEPVGACRQCLVEVEGQRKPMASCTTVATDDMVVRTQLTSEAADKAQHGVMELLLINHPLDCPMCDKGGECPLQNQAMSNGRADSRFTDEKRTFAKPINISSQVLLDRERCILCARCTRFSEQIAGDPFIDMQERGALQQVGIYANEPFDSYFSGNTVQICPVGALTGTAYRFRARPFDLVSSPSVCEHCASGCAQRTDHRRGKVLRRLAGDDPEVNEEWNCDKGRWAFTYATQPDVITTPLVRDADGSLQPTSWSHAIAVATQGLEAARGRTGVLVGGRATLEDAYAYSKFARIVLDSNDIDFRARPSSAEEADFLAARIAGRPMTVSYADLESAPVVVLAGFEPEDESPIVFLRLRKAARKRGLPVYAVAPFATRALDKMSGRLIKTVPGAEAAALDGLATGEVGDLLSTPARSSWSANAWPPCRADCPLRRGSPIPPAPAWPGCRGAPASGARWRPVRCPGCCPAAVRWTTRPPGRRWRGPGTCPNCPPAVGVTPTASWPPPPTGRWARCWWVASSPTTSPTPKRCWRRWTVPASWSASRCGTAPSRSAPTWCSRSRRRHRRPARSSTGRVASGPSTPRCATPRTPPSPTTRCSTRWPTRWASTWACPPSTRPAKNWPRCGTGTASAPRARTSRRRSHPRSALARRCWPAGGCCWTTPECRTVSHIWRERPANPSCGCPPTRPPRSAPPRATR